MSSDFFNMLENEMVVECIEKFRIDACIDTLLDIKDYIWEEGTCYPDFYIIIPQIIYQIKDLNISESKDYWEYIGSWVATQNYFRNNINEEILFQFDNSLKVAEYECMSRICNLEKINDVDAEYLYLALFSFAKHRLGYMALGNYRDAIEGTSIARCSKNHISDFTVFDTGIVKYEEDEQPCEIASVEVDDENVLEETDNPWMQFAYKFEKILDSGELEDNIKSHFLMSLVTLKKGISPELDMKKAFSLYACMLYSNGSISESMRVFHAYDTVSCEECGEKFIFAEGWCEDNIFKYKS